jgi:hypothetical protein
LNNGVEEIDYEYENENEYYCHDYNNTFDER